MDTIRDALRRAAESGLVPRGSRVMLAVSGGADSMALLYGASETAAGETWALLVAHVHHGWRGRDADRDLSFVSGHAQRLGLPFVSRLRNAREAARRLKLSPEAAARVVRYEALLEMARETGTDRVLTAHQQDDVLESYAIAQERRGGLARLAGPREARADGVVRPLLSVSRAQILAFLAERGISFRRDASNGDLRLTRNRVRRSIAGLDASSRAWLVAEVARLSLERRSIERELTERVAPTFECREGARRADAALLAVCGPELLRAALETLAAPFALPGRPPMTGRERERIVHLIREGGDFRFEAGRRIRFESRAGTLAVRLRNAVDAAPVYHFGTTMRGEDRPGATSAAATVA
jgi:tRNA(Ile)-lysidine synthetase-like protein